MALNVALLRKLAIAGAVVAAGAVWTSTMKASLARTEWKGVWSSAGDVRGKQVDITGKTIDIAEARHEREKRLRRERLTELGVSDKLHDAKRQVLGANAEVRGDDIERDRLPLPDGFRDYTPREVCMQQKLQFPDEFGHIDCFTDSYDGDFSWIESNANAASEDEDE